MDVKHFDVRHGGAVIPVVGVRDIAGNTVLLIDWLGGYRTEAVREYIAKHWGKLFDGDVVDAIG